MKEAAERRRAALQWRYLNPSDRIAGENVPEVFANRLNEALGQCNETYSVGVELAFRLGHQRVASIEDHSEKDALLPIMAELEKVHGESKEATELLSSSIYAELP